VVVNLPEEVPSGSNALRMVASGTPAGVYLSSLMMDWAILRRSEERREDWGLIWGFESVRLSMRGGEDVRRAFS
jgi:hypothetical protein